MAKIRSNPLSSDGFERTPTYSGLVYVREAEQSIHFQGPKSGVALTRSRYEVLRKTSPHASFTKLTTKVVALAAGSTRVAEDEEATKGSDKTYSPKPTEVERNWFVVDASEYNLGRLATRVATVLRGKHKPIFTPHVDTGDFVIVVNAGLVKLSGNKSDRKHYHRYSGYPGGLHSKSADEVREEDPDRMIRQAVRGMLPKNRLSRQILRKLKVYAGEEHPHGAQKPLPFPKL